MQETGQPFEVALAVTRAGNLFTTHTAVAAGFDRFAPELIEQYLGDYAEQKLGLSRRDSPQTRKIQDGVDSKGEKCLYLNDYFKLSITSEFQK